MKQIIAFFLWMSLALSLSAQHEPQGQSLFDDFTFGLEMGASTSLLLGPFEKGASITPFIRMMPGVFARYEINPKFSAQVGLNYVVQKVSYFSPVTSRQYYYYNEFEIGGQVVVQDVGWVELSNGHARGKMNNKYIRLPFSVSYLLNDKGLRLLAGGYVSRLVSREHDVWATGTVGNNFAQLDDHYSDEKHSIAPWDYGLGIGVNYEFMKKLEAEFRISSGVRSVFRDDYTGVEETIVNMFAELKVNYTFQL